MQARGCSACGTGPGPCMPPSQEKSPCILNVACPCDHMTHAHDVLQALAIEHGYMQVRELYCRPVTDITLMIRLYDDEVAAS